MAFKFFHVLGVILLIGNVTVSAVWKVFADRDADPRVITFAQRLVTMTDWTLTSTGIALVAIGGYGMLYVSGESPVNFGWLVYGQVLFAVSGALWVLILVPSQIRLARLARAKDMSAVEKDAYFREGRFWILWGIAATIPLVAALWIMIVKPDL